MCNFQIRESSPFHTKIQVLSLFQTHVTYSWAIFGIFVKISNYVGVT